MSRKIKMTVDNQDGCVVVDEDTHVCTCKGQPRLVKKKCIHCNKKIKINLDKEFPNG
jgi:hypothetical protein